MSDSDDDWFNKDLDEFKVHKSSLNNVDNISVRPSNSDSKHNNNISENRYVIEGFPAEKNYQQTTKLPPMSGAKLRSIGEQTPVVAFLEIMHPDSGFLLCLKRKSNAEETILLLLNAICKALRVPFDENVKCLCEQVVAEENFWNQCLKYLTETTGPPPKSPKSKPQSITHKNIEEIWQRVTELCQAIVDHEIRLKEPFLKKAIQLAENNKNDSLQVDLYVTNLKKCWELGKSLNELSRTSRNLYPSLDELTSDTLPPRNSNIFNGIYKDVSHYLDIHLALLREDFLSPLQDGVQMVASKTPSDINVYRHITILITEKEYKTIKRREVKKTVCIVADLESKRRKRSGSSTHYSVADYSQCFLLGSLLFFTTSEEFTDLIVAKVQSRDSVLLEHGYIDIVIVQTYNIANIFEKEFIMFESNRYFYRQIYEVLKNFNSNTFPLQSQLIKLDTTEEYPSYVPNQKKVIYKYRKNLLDIKNTSTWPSPEALNLHVDHLIALKRSLTHKISAIPTSGADESVFIATEIIATLYQNTNSQILVLCKSGKTLAKILSDIQMYTEDIVQIENHTSNEQLEKFNLKEITSDFDSENIYKLINAYRYTLHSKYRVAVEKFSELQLKMKENGMQNNYMKEYLDIQLDLESFSKRLDEMKQIASFQCIKSKRIIGMTNFTASKFQTLIQLLQTPIVIIEGADGVLEAHTVATLTTNLMHLILIGQRKKTSHTRRSNAFVLSKFYQTSFSLFDRIIGGDKQSGENTQISRKGPSIQEVLLKNKPKEPVLGIEKFIFLLQYKIQKLMGEDTNKNAMNFESRFLLALCIYLLKQGYAADDLTVLTITLEQKQQVMMDKEIYQDHQDVYMNLCRVCVDSINNFEGKSNGIILLSMIQPKDKDQIINASTEIMNILSRTKIGFFIVGNIQWGKSLKKIQRGITKQEAIDSEMALRCQTHGNITKVKEAKDIEKLQFGGCEMQCNQLLPCGHLCEKVCHTKKYLHSLCDCEMKTL